MKATTNGFEAFFLLFNENIVHDLSDILDSDIDIEEKPNATKKGKK